MRATAFKAISYYPVYLLKSVIASLLMIAPMFPLVQHGTPGLIAAVSIAIPIYLAALWLLRSFEPEEVDFAKRALNRLRGKKA